MSDSEDASPAPSDAKIESTLKRIVAQKVKSDRENLSVKSVRTAVEQELKLTEGWLKNHRSWNARSKGLIESEFARLESSGGGSEHEEAAVAKKSMQKKSNNASATSKKRKSAEAPDRVPKKAPPKKKRKVSSDEEDDASDSQAISSGAESEASHLDMKKTPKKAKAASKAAPKSAPKDPVPRSKSKIVVDSEDEDGDVAMKATSPKKPKLPVVGDHAGEDDTVTKKSLPKLDANDGNLSESSMSSLLDEAPTKKKRQRKSPAPKPTKSKGTAKAKPSAKKGAKELAPDDEEIKRLQGWLVKCGIRKVWGKELKPYETPKAKIAHLKGMLSDAGMTGRYSIEKANEIKERRELAADLEAVTDFDRKWGQKDEERPRRKASMAADLGLDPSLIDDPSDDDD